MFKADFIASSLRISSTKVGEFSRIWTDSRTCKKGDLFAAISGEKFDGHEFVFKAAELGATGAIVSKKEFLDRAKLPSQFQIFEVSHTTEALRQIAKAYRAQLQIPIFAVAGSNGKTTTKEWLAYLLRHLYSPKEIFKTDKSNNSILGIALSLLQIRSEKMAVIEIGIDEPGWMDQHLEVVQPTHGLITTVAEEHLNRLKSIEIIAKEELKLLDYLRSKNASFAMNIDSEWITKAEPTSKTLTYALEAPAQIEGKFIPPQTLHAFGLEWHNPLPGKHNAQNLLAAIAGIKILIPNLNLNDLKKLSLATKDFQGEPHRSQWLKFKNDIQVYDDAYNANPDSMEKALQAFLELSDGCHQRVVLGDMLDLGDATDEAHRRILNRASVLGFDQIYLFGNQFAKAFSEMKIPTQNIRTYESINELASELKKDLKSGETLFLKGSRGMSLERLIPKIFS
ncbi:MAG: UDP-N-acetylmuramoyl-tripeptide--D-alanyl-D-alanine ligase [Deltaproteobacteria bacterium]|nr:UDP-N-acetylmuramoyl-tripeptide--D-alanyl-D-alanine ligase [Deltaproteobacteria bacterium]